MKGKPIDQLVYKHMFPKPKTSDPQNFHAFLQKHLVNEVRAETNTFYGSIDSRESQYPGLDYSHQPHRMRLGRFPWHKKLFKAFDALGLTKSEIASLTKWEGTIWAKERFEKEQGIIIRDTTGDCIKDWVPQNLRPRVVPTSPTPMSDLQSMTAIVRERDDEEDDSDSMSSDDDTELSSVGVELNQRLRAAAAQRDAGNSNAIIDEEFEQWLKEAAEAGGWGNGHDSAAPVTMNVTSTGVPPRLLNAARLGHWAQVPEYSRSLMRDGGYTRESSTIPSRIVTGSAGGRINFRLGTNSADTTTS